MSSEANCTTPSDQPITLLAPPCTQLFGPDCVIEILYCAPSEIEPSLEHRFLRCTLCGTEASSTAERQDWCTTMQRSKSACGCPDCGSSIVQGLTEAVEKEGQ